LSAPTVGFEFVNSIADEATQTHGSTASLAPVVSADSRRRCRQPAVGRAALGTALNGTIEIAGPRQFFAFDELVRMDSARPQTTPLVVGDPHALLGALRPSAP